ncbi:hypothetical protein SMICM304S_11283 [Streptomyces microflavus]
MSGAVTEPRSLSSLRNQASTKATRTTGAAYRNTSVMEVEYALRIEGRRSAGSIWMARGSAASRSASAPGGTDRPARALSSCPVSRLVKTVPKMATPNEAPMERKNVAPEVATPRSWYETAFCTTRTRTCMTRPSPAPKTKK